MSSITGIWDLTLKTPIGVLDIVYTFDHNSGAITGIAESKGETIPLTDITCENNADGQHVTWQQSLTNPMRLNLNFDVTVAEDTLTGQFRAGKLLRSSVTGIRRNTNGNN